ncbi:hypothetical protein HANVADRAFT_50919 [Hanseniaspora valbyensis NRRL Y-1626]|uniref:Alcohol dehydrogenase-like N-terminal domain-containing protein n=1 Tax=Hanseniaspora valbyensis NRRL Y-1626 TaxID=766949 RepID=A0A1B7TJQ2_9ASCO|nr:hypothetical protein HANVADRAFT_50919 [Hanseniaspora valbyensis NRRL Y-1626]
MSHLKPSRGYLNSDPKPLPQEENVLKRQPRPLRMVKYVPTKRLQYNIPIKEFDFSYDHKISKKLKKNEVIIQVEYVGLNGLDWKIKNGFDYAYDNSIVDFNSETCLGIEFAGEIIEVADKMDSDLNFQIGRKVMGIYYDIHNGTMESCIKVNLKTNLVIAQPNEISSILAGGSIFNLLTVLQIFRNILYKEIDTFKANNANILIIGGATNTSVMLLKYLNKMVNVKNVTIIASYDGCEYLKNIFYQWNENNWNFINYYENDHKDELLDIVKTFGKYKYVFNFVGGEEYLSFSNELVKSKGYFISTVGSLMSNYSTDIYPESYYGSSVDNLKSWASSFWKFYYYKFQFNFNYDAQLLMEAEDLLQNQQTTDETRVLTCQINKVYDWKDFKEAFRQLKSQKTKGKIILKIEKF